MIFKTNITLLSVILGSILNVFGQAQNDSTQVKEIGRTLTSKVHCVIPPLATEPIYTQYQFDDFLTGNKGKAIISNVNLQSGSNYLPVNLLSQIYKGGGVDESLRLSALNTANFSNLRLGAIAEGQMKVVLNFKNRKRRFYKGFSLVNGSGVITVGSNSILNGKLQPDIAALYLLGNGVFADKTAFLGPSLFQYYQYNSVGFNHWFHVYKYGTDPELISIKDIIGFNVGLQLNQLNNFQSVQIMEGSMYTALFGQFLDLDYTIKLQKLKDEHPLGLGLNLGLSRSIKGLNTSLSLNNFGFWKLHQMQVLSADTSFRYQGIVLQTWGQSPSLPSDSLKDILGLHASSEKARLLLPGNLKLQLRYTNLWRLDITYWYTLKALPLFELQYTKWSNKYVKLGQQRLRHSFYPYLAYGGFGTYHLGFSTGIQYKKIAIMLNVNDLQSFVLKNQTSLIAGLRIGYAF